MIAQPKREPVRIVVPTSVGYDLKRFKECLVRSVTLHGCPTCASGRPGCVYQFRDAAVTYDEKLEAHHDAPAADEAIHPAVAVTLPPSVSNDIALISRVVDQIAGKLGCLACTSGFDLIFQQEIESIASPSYKVSPEGNLAVAG